MKIGCINSTHLFSVEHAVSRRSTSRFYETAMAPYRSRIEARNRSVTHSKDASSGTLDVDAASSTEYWAKSSEMGRMDWM